MNFTLYWLVLDFYDAFLYNAHVRGHPLFTKQIDEKRPLFHHHAWRLLDISSGNLKSEWKAWQYYSVLISRQGGEPKSESSTELNLTVLTTESRRKSCWLVISRIRSKRNMTDWTGEIFRFWVIRSPSLNNSLLLILEMQ